MAKISNKMKIKNEDGTFEDIQISYIGPNGTWAEGEETVASGASSHAEGYQTIASGDESHAEGCGTKAIDIAQHVQGKYNEPLSDYAHIVGNGLGAARRSNAHTLDWDGNAWFAGNVTVGKKNKKLVCVDDIYPVGSVYITSTNENPATYLGGNWKLVDKHFAYNTFETGEENFITANSSNVSSLTSYIQRNPGGFSIYITAIISNSISDDTYEFGTINWSALGCSQIMVGARAVGYTDGGNAIICGALGYSSGKIQSLDVIVKRHATDEEHVVPSGSQIYFQFEAPVPISHRLDSACDKFYWKRYETFTFKIGDISYEAETGMTWAEWVNTAYNTNGVTISGNAVVPPIGTGYIWDEQYTATEDKNNLIIKDSNYIID